MVAVRHSLQVNGRMRGGPAARSRTFWQRVAATRLQRQVVRNFCCGRLCTVLALSGRPLGWVLRSGSAWSCGLPRSARPCGCASRSSRSRPPPPLSSAPRLSEGSYSDRREPERVDDPKMLETAFGAGFAKEVLRDSEPNCRLSRREGRLLVDFLRWHESVAADHRLTKILVRA